MECVLCAKGEKKAAESCQFLLWSNPYYWIHISYEAAVGDVLAAHKKKCCVCESVLIFLLLLERRKKSNVTTDVWNVRYFKESREEKNQDKEEVKKERRILWFSVKM